jgi:hypothetical protein
MDKSAGESVDAFTMTYSMRGAHGPFKLFPRFLPAHEDRSCTRSSIFVPMFQIHSDLSSFGATVFGAHTGLTVGPSSVAQHLSPLGLAQMSHFCSGALGSYLLRESYVERAHVRLACYVYAVGLRLCF